MILAQPLGQTAAPITTLPATASLVPGSAIDVMRRAQATSPGAAATSDTDRCPMGREPTAVERASGCNRVCIDSTPPTESECGPYSDFAMTPCGGECRTSEFCVGRQIASDPSVNTCRPPYTPGGRTSDGRLVCVQCSPGHVPDRAAMRCVLAPTPPTITEDVIPWLDRPLKARMQDLLLPAVFYKYGFYDLGSAVMTSADGRTIIVRDHRIANISILDALGVEDKATYWNHARDSKLAWRPGSVLPVKLRVGSGTLPFVTWDDNLTGAKVGAFYNPGANSITIKWWDPYTLSDLLDDVIGGICSVVNNGAAVAIAVKAAPLAGVSTSTAQGIVAAAKLLCGSSVTGPSPTPETPGDAIMITGTMLPAGTIHIYDGGIYRIAIPVGASAALQGYGLGQAATAPTYKEIAPSTSDPAPKGSTLTDKEKFLVATGQYRWYKDWKYMVPISVAVVGAVTGTVIVIRRRRRRPAR